ncbi:MAG: hypothetical protein ABIP17_03425 [Ilumatobacteraceae bacterium]
MWRVLTATLAIGTCAVIGPAPAQAQEETPPTSAPPSSAPPSSSLPSDDESVDVEGGSGGVVDGETDVAPPDTLPLVPVPTGCTAPRLPHIVFSGTVVDRDFRTIRYRIEQIRTGRSAPFADGDLIDVRYGLDQQYLDDGDTYLVAAVVDLDIGLLVSRVTEPIENFGGDEVIGVSETDVNCPVYEDPMRTLHLDGTAIDGSVLEPFFASKLGILGAVLLPFGFAVAAIFLLATFRLSLSGLYRSIVDTGHRRVG